jgi:hypothetical protein
VATGLDDPVQLPALLLSSPPATVMIELSRVVVAVVVTVLKVVSSAVPVTPKAPSPLAPLNNVKPQMCCVLLLVKLTFWTVPTVAVTIM